jgi:transposase InsO family protein
MKKHLTKQQVLAYRRRVLADADKLEVTTVARRYGVYRSTIYRWRDEIIPQKPGPRSKVFWQTDEETEVLILQLRLSTNYGPKRLKDELSDYDVAVGEKAIRGVIEDVGLVKKQRKPRKKTSQPFYAPYPGYRLQVDTKAVPNDEDKRKSRRQQFTAIDIVSKIRYLKVMDGLSNGNSITFVKEALAFFAEIGIKIECVQTDNHSTFTNLFSGSNKKSDHELRRIHPLTLFLVGKRIEHKLSRPGTPQHNGFVERSHRTDEEEFYRVTKTAGVDISILQTKMSQWQDEYNNTRRHSSCNNLPPVEFYNTIWQPRLAHV